MKELYELVIFTSAEKEYADTILDYLEEKSQYFSHRLYYDQCIHKQGSYLFKALPILSSGRNPKDIIIVDNLISNYSLSVRNGIPIFDYEGDDNDLQLVYLAKYLRKLSNVASLQEIIKQDFANFLLKHYKST